MIGAGLPARLEVLAGGPLKPGFWLEWVWLLGGRPIFA